MVTTDGSWAGRRRAEEACAVALAAVAIGAASGAFAAAAEPTPAPATGLDETDDEERVVVGAGRTSPVGAPAGQDRPSPSDFTIGELVAGEVTAAAFNAAWEAAAERVAAGPCPRPETDELVVIIDLGATPPPALGPDYHDHAPAMAAARAAACAD